MNERNHMKEEALKEIEEYDILLQDENNSDVKSELLEKKTMLQYLLPDQQTVGGNLTESALTIFYGCSDEFIDPEEAEDREEKIDDYFDSEIYKEQGMELLLLLKKFNCKEAIDALSAIEYFELY